MTFLSRFNNFAALALPSDLRRAPRSAKVPVGKDVFAVIDYGCPFMHPLLCSATAGGGSTRVRALWDQQPHAGTDARTAPNGFSYGNELSRARPRSVACGSSEIGTEGPTRWRR